MPPISLAPPMPIGTDMPYGLALGNSTSTTLIPTAVANSVGSLDIQNNARGGGFYTGVINMTPAAQPSVTSQPAAYVPRTLPAVSVYGYTSTFMAQAIAQGANDNMDFYMGTSSLSPTPDKALLDSFALTKYRPSNASKPVVQETGAARLFSGLQQSLELARAVEKQAEPQPTNPTPRVQDLGARPEAAMVDTTDIPRVTRAERTMPRRSLIRAQGFDAYEATVERSAQNTNKPATQAS